ncbi:MAG: DUF6883 domain-containing protein [Microcystis panniformis]|jgi:hypothetical protein|uniref:DUF6883 domain-containing protein n=6 Tax=Microcystis TaxID=1125 RepID=A0A2H6BNU6_MICAE|nr:MULTISPECIES: DUF6883 domain-containing protein [Microcystis]MBE5230344.1 hypothetical protein [Microcystis aeruginosa PMC 728.11]MDJ0559293.1 hypothetical protein [Microcystis sp. M53599_WE4]NCS30785.1 hypothetical protein [Microcystis aeruginosa F13-15]TRU29290.1 MAG: hypothetical protein EWV80_04230 [Microcystis aeruginosa Ma_QC_B_20070730_S2]ARI80212.1 hypothetical protein BH695_0931 [Microcystis aeruginosa PCC 7806SL]
MPYLNPNATIPPAKLTQYLLVLQPKDDKSGFLAQAGYNLDNWQVLEQDLRRILLNEATLNKQTKFGDIYEIKGLLQGVNGINLRVSTYWIIDSLTKETRFVTLLPD